MLTYKDAIDDFNRMVSTVLIESNTPTLEGFCDAVKVLEIQIRSYNEKVQELTINKTAPDANDEATNKFFSKERRPRIQQFVKTAEYLTGSPDLTFGRSIQTPHPSNLYFLWGQLVEEAQHLSEIF